MSAVLGVDWSLTSTGLAWVDLETLHTDTATVRTGPDDGNIRGIGERFRLIGDQVEAWADLHADDLVVIELPLLHVRSAHRSKMIGGWWDVATRLQGLVDDPVMGVAPRERAKFATGDGNAGKAAVMGAVRERFRMFTPANDDEADAVVLAVMGARTLGHDLERRNG